MTRSSEQAALPSVNESAPEALLSVVSEIEADLEARLVRAELPENLRAAIRYAVLGGGKRLRPALVVLSCEAVGGSHTQALPAAAAIELIHAFSLVHDDLPAMDDDDLRRGCPSLHVHAGEAMAILAGDVMVSLAFEFLSASDLESAKRVQLTAELSRATTSMIAGQVYDTLGGFEDQLNDRQRLQLIHDNKTGALLRAACRMGGIGGGATPDQLQALTAYGQAMGLMFQIVDDLLDVTQSAEHIGKATGKDEPAGKLTFPGLLGVAGSRREITRMRETACDALAPLGSPAQPLRDLCILMAVRTK